MRNRRSMISRGLAISLPCFIFLSFFPGSILSAAVTLKSIELYNTHEWIPRKPAMYFRCSGENRTSLPDVQETNVLYSFKGEESWQPLTELRTKKCKRCGIYQELFMSDHAFDEWELCSSDFAAPDGNYTRFKENEFNTTLLCKGCLSLDKDSPPTDEESDRGGKKHHVIPIVVTVAVFAVVAVISVAGFKYWQKKRRQQEQARFLKLFEEEDDMGELGLSEML